MQAQPPVGGHTKSQKFIVYLLILWLTGTLACRQPVVHADRVVVVQPLGDFSAATANAVYNELKSVLPAIQLKRPIPLPAHAYYAPRSRYRADSLIAYLRQFGNSDTVVIGLTNRDISTTKGAIKDWGVMGFGYKSGVCLRCLNIPFVEAKAAATILQSRDP